MNNQSRLARMISTTANNGRAAAGPDHIGHVVGRSSLPIFASSPGSHSGNLRAQSGTEETSEWKRQTASANRERRGAQDSGSYRSYRGLHSRRMQPFGGFHQFPRGRMHTLAEFLRRRALHNPAGIHYHNFLRKQRNKIK